MTFCSCFLDASTLPGQLDELCAVYRRAFVGLPHCETDDYVERFVESLRRHKDREGFRCYVVRAEDRPVAFGYGYTSR